MCATNLSQNKMPSESRKIRKPLMEKKRRARINDCLEELKKMLLQNKKECIPDGRPAKLEKADILEQTVDYMKRLMDPLTSYNQGFLDSEERTRSLIGKYENMSPHEKKMLCAYLFSKLRIRTAILTTKFHQNTNENQSKQEIIWRPW